MTDSRRYTIHESGLVVFSPEDLPQEIAGAIQILLLGGKAWEEELGTVLISVLPNNTDSCKLIITTTVHARIDISEPSTIIARLHELIGENVLGVQNLNTSQDRENPRQFFTKGIIPVKFIADNRE